MALHNCREIDVSKQDGKRKIIDTFINAIYVSDDALPQRGRFLDARKLAIPSRCSLRPHHEKRMSIRASFFRGIVDSCAKLQIIAGSREERAWKGCKKSKNLTSDDALPQRDRYLSTAANQYNPNQILITSEWFGFTFTL